MTDPEVDADTLVDCTCGHRKDDHCNGIEYCKRYDSQGRSCRCFQFTFRSAEDRAKFDLANERAEKDVI